MRKTTCWISTLAAVALLALTNAGCTAKMKAAYHLQRAERYYAAGQYAAAEIEYKNVLRHAPQNAEAWARLGIIYADEGRPLEAFPMLTRAEQLAPTNLTVRVKLGKLDVDLGMPKEALAEAEYVLARKPRDDEAPLLLASAVATNDIPITRLRLQALQQNGNSAALEVALGILALRQRDFKTAETAFERATTLAPKSSMGYTALGDLYLMQKDLKRAEPAYKKAAELAQPWSGADLRYAQFKIATGDAQGGKALLQDIVKKTPDYLPAWLDLARLTAAGTTNYTDALAVLENVLSRDPQSFEGLMLKGRWLMASGQTDQAIGVFEDLTRMYSRSPMAYCRLAEAYLAGNKNSAAYASVNQALKLDPKYPDAVLLLAQMQIQDGNAATAIAALKPLVQQQPQAVPAWLLLASAYRAQGDLDNAARIYEQLEKTFPQNPQIPLLRGMVLAQQHQNAQARREFERAEQLAPNSLAVLEQLVNLDLSERQYSAALQRVQQKLEKNPDAPALQLLLGQVLAMQGDTNRAEAAFSKVIALQPDAQTAYLLLAQLYVNAGQTQKALTNLQTALTKNPKDATALMLMGMIYDGAKDYANACDAYEKLLVLAPNNALALNNLACDYADHLNQLDKALPLARQARDAAPSNPAIADTLGWILYRKGQYAAALPLLRDSANRLSTAPVIQFHLGMVCYMTGLEAEARSAFQRALQLTGDFPEKDKNECKQRLAILDIDAAKAGPEQRDWLEKWTAAHPDDSVAVARLAAIYQRAGMADKAKAAYETLLKANPQNLTALVNLARLYAPTDAAKAFGFAKSAYQLTPNDPEVARLAGRLAFVTGDYRWALTLLQLAAQAQPQNPDTLFELAEAFYSQGRVTEARTAMQNALQTGTAFARSDDAKRFLSLTALADAPAQALAEQAQVAEALKSAPNSVPALMAQAAIAEQKADTAGAEQICQQVLKIYPDFTPAQRQLALLYAKDPKNDATAYPLALKARQAFPNDPAVAGALGMMVCRQGDYARAVSLLQESARQKNPEPEWLYYLGLAQYRLKHNAESKAALQQALNLHLAGDLAADAKRILAALK